MFHNTAFWICSVSGLFAVGADGRLRGSDVAAVLGNSTAIPWSTEEYSHKIYSNSTQPGRGQRHLRIFGSDDREEFENYAYPWSTVGKVETSSGSCTGTLVGPSLMLTAQHCVKCNSDGTVGGMKFTPGYYEGRAPFGSAKAERFHWNSRIPCADSFYDSEFAWDYVIVKLNKRLGDKVGWMGFKQYDTNWNGGNYWMHIGYGGDIADGERPLWHDKSSIRSAKVYVKKGTKTKSYLLFHGMDSTKGHSGGPVFGFFGNNDPYVIAAHNSAGGDAAGGPGLNDLIAGLRARYD
ncbi:hypothetical protein ACHAWF_010285 [Thalassiosira exigua]